MPSLLAVYQLDNEIRELQEEDATRRLTNKQSALNYGHKQSTERPSS